MRNDELFHPHCPDNHADKLVKGYAMRGLLGNNGTCYQEDLVVRQHAIYEDWLAEMRKLRPDLPCDFYEWLSREGDVAFVFKPGDLVKFDNHYCVVARRCTREVTWTNDWHIRNGVPVKEAWPRPVTDVELKDSSGKTTVVNAMCESIVPTIIPQEVFELACEKAKNCPMMRGGVE